MDHKFDTSGYYLLQEASGDKIVSFAMCEKCWNNKVKTDKFLYRFRFVTHWIDETKSIWWKPELIPVDCECEFDKFKETVYRNL